ncbi:GIY-YIG nuclease family protein [Alishewanella sp. 16-MA]|uniref:GIY-YIG nuclease family protein n=1 Tax=Alishewanella maricola TaxID=2795740 RepID=A0ABS8BZT8_9ALTE|nr:MULTISPECIES: GIY-YIG nuclease family protein [Alishewanella]MDP4946131.1 GIY-YIG nuclease family protein [Alishewanella sp.]MDP5205980.1 GIY-YIG nuclease family protein [Alishewanella sp. SMS9]MCB5225591.1 GIY-YIG nuclease family protein [Alishewanella maricola]MDP5035718.1 GIY-YIG nuclease family protein [Alishewanella sp.]MDP5187552.1 GIY-YIG nuclease family protein [Alishewanella sp.]
MSALQDIATPSPAWVLYMVRTAAGQLYTGITVDPQRRMRQHAGEIKGGAKALRGKGPLTLVYQRRYSDRASASQAEYQLKQLSKAEKEQLISEQ